MSEFFPLYSDIISICKGKKVTNKRKKLISKKIEELKHNAKEIVYVLIFSHSLKENNEDLFQCKRKINHDNTVNLNWDLNYFPNELCEILEIFLEKERKSEQQNQEQLHLKMNLKLDKGNDKK